ncbi:MAG TPA: permease [Kiritimatiellia bacterium]|nr:permease [Kiritimatiellia bacterium]HMO98536.1 permease [Kiritimatiellia bacterium]HMP96978.1 permease [Kiritimatiellia bacterium]
MNREVKAFLWILAGFLAAYFMPVESERFTGAIVEALALVKWYAQEHVLLCLVPAFFIAGAIGVFVSQNAVMKYFGPKANKLLSYGVASVSGTILAVCSCTVLPIFGGIYMRGAGLGPAVAFLYSGPAINVLAIVMTARILGAPLGIARAIGAVVFSIVIGVLMHLIFLKDERAKAANAVDLHLDDDEKPPRPLWQTALYFFSMAAVLVFANWAKPASSSGLWYSIHAAKWWLTSGFAVITAVCLWRYMEVKLWHLLVSAVGVAALGFAFPGNPAVPFTAGAIALAIMTVYNSPEMKDWGGQTWGFAKQITPLLLGGVLAAGFFLGSPESSDAGVIPNRWIQMLVGDDPSIFWGVVYGGDAVAPGWLSALWPLWTNFFASITGALMYFATLTEVPILRGLMDSGMGQGPALALLLAGPALSLPNMLVINAIIGPKKTATFVALVVVMATASGMVFGWMGAGG